MKDINWSYSRGYARHYKFGFMHRLIMNPPEELDVDHINGDTSDNRRCNLRSGETYQNLANTRKSAGRSSKYKGVTWNKLHTVWKSSILFRGKSFYLGSFDVEEEAAKAYDRKALELRGEWSYQTLNFPELLEEYLKELKQ